MPPTDVEIQVTLARHEERLGNLENRMIDVEEICKNQVDLRVAIGKLEMQIKITWALMVMIIGGLVSVAFSLWTNGGMP